MFNSPTGISRDKSEFPRIRRQGCATPATISAGLPVRPLPQSCTTGSRTFIGKIPTCASPSTSRISRKEPSIIRTAFVNWCNHAPRTAGSTAPVSSVGSRAERLSCAWKCRSLAVAPRPHRQIHLPVQLDPHQISPHPPLAAVFLQGQHGLQLVTERLFFVKP